MIFATSCENELELGAAGEESVVSFTIATPDMGSRAYSDGTTATKLQYAVYDAAGNILRDLQGSKTMENRGAKIDLKLTTGNSYSVIFWAAATNAPYTVDFDAKTMTVNYTGAKSNDETRDAFYKYHEFTVNGAQTETIELKRPFAQLNIGTADYEASQKAGYVPTQSAVKVKNVYSTLDLATGDVDDEVEEVTFGFENIPTGETFPVTGYEYLAMNYVLVPADQELTEVTFSYRDANNNEKDRTVGSVPVQRNYRTNIYGQLLTSDVDINVEIKPGFEDEENNISVWDGKTVTAPVADGAGVYHISTAAEFVGMMADSKNPNCNKYQNVVLESNIDFGGYEISGFGDDSGFFDGIFDGQGHIVSNFKIDATSRTYYAGLFNQVSQYSGENTVIKNLTVKDAKISGSGQVGAIVGGMNGNTVVENCKVIGCELKAVKKVGAVVGYTAGGTVKDCYAANCVVSYSEKEGSEVVGYENTGSTVEGNTYENVTVMQSIDAEGVGIKDGNYVVTSAEGFEWIAEAVENGTLNDKTIVLNNDIDLSAMSRAAVSNWTPIGTAENPFTGTFDGNGKTIKNLIIVEPTAKEGKAYIGFFGYANNATIKNVTFENVNINIPCLDIDHSQGHIGAVAGSLEGTSTIENVTVKGDIKVYATQTANGASRVAVVAGGNSYGNVTIKNVHVNANEGSYLIANNNTGAIAGQLQGKTVYENCSSNINVTVNKFFAGGIVGLAGTNDEFINCHTTGNIAVVAGRAGRAHDQYRVGGIAGGWADGAKNVCTLVNCSYTGKVSGKNSDGSVAEPLDYLGYVGRGYTLNGCQGSKVVINGVSFIQTAEAGKYVNENGEKYISEGLYYAESTKTYVVTSAEGLIALSSKTIEGGVTVTLGADINLEGKEFNGLSAFNPEINNTFDGKGYTVSNWTNQSGASDMGFIKSWVGTIKNVTIDNAKLKTAGRSAILAGKVYSNIEDCHVVNSVIEDSYWACGIIAGLHNSGNITGCTVTNSSIKSNGGTGGIVGVINETAGTRTIKDCKVNNTTVNNSGVYGESYSAALFCGMINIANSTVKFVGCEYANNTKDGKFVGDLYYNSNGCKIVVE